MFRKPALEVSVTAGAAGAAAPANVAKGSGFIKVVP